LQHARAIGLDCDTSTDFGERRRLFVKADVHSVLNECGCRGSTTDASADHGHAKREFSHEQLVSSMAVLPLVANVALGLRDEQRPPRVPFLWICRRCDRLRTWNFPHTSSVLSAPAMLSAAL
jgi:hypothetical protein